MFPPSIHRTEANTMIPTETCMDLFWTRIWRAIFLGGHCITRASLRRLIVYLILLESKSYISMHRVPKWLRVTNPNPVWTARVYNLMVFIKLFLFSIFSFYYWENSSTQLFQLVCKRSTSARDEFTVKTILAVSPIKLSFLTIPQFSIRFVKR